MGNQARRKKSYYFPNEKQLATFHDLNDKGEQ